MRAHLAMYKQHRVTYITYCLFAAILRWSLGHWFVAVRTASKIGLNAPGGALRRLAVSHSLRRMPIVHHAGVFRPVVCCRIACLFVVRGCCLFFLGPFFQGIVWSSYYILQHHVFPPLRDSGALHLGLNRQAYRVTFGTFYIFSTQNIRNSNTPRRPARTP